MEILEPDEKVRVERKASNLQFKHMLAVYKGNQWVPIAFDVLDGFLCNETLTHKAVLTDKPYIGYAYPMNSCRYLSDVYIQSDVKGTELKVLPSWFGAGFYEEKVDYGILVNSANGALGVHNDTTLNIGLDYCLAKENLDPAT